MITQKSEISLMSFLERMLKLTSQSPLIILIKICKELYAWRNKVSPFCDDKAKSKNGGSFWQPNLEFDKDTKIRSKLLSTTINHSVLFESQTSSTKRNLKDDISYLLRRLINEKKKQTVLVDQINEHQRNHEQYVTMKEIPSIDIE